MSRINKLISPIFFEIYNKNKIANIKTYIYTFLVFIAFTATINCNSFLDQKNDGLGGSAIERELYELILKILPKGKTIVELGSGSGTAHLCKHYNVYSVEHDSKFLNLYPTNYIYAPIKESWYDNKIIKKELPLNYDLILVDGPPGYNSSCPGRSGFYEFINLFKKNIPIIIDDVDRTAEFILMEKVSKYFNRKYKIFTCKNSNKKFALIDNKEKSKIKLYTFCTPSHKILRDQYFLPSIKDDYEIIVKNIKNQVCQSGTYYTSNWHLAVLNKAYLIIEAIIDNWGDYFIYSDLDIQFIQPTKKYIIENIKSLDMLGQSDRRENKDICSGFMVIRANKKTYDLWNKVKNLILKTKQGDQYCLNVLLKTSNIKYEILPNQFYSPRKGWHPGDTLDIPNNIMLHHANYTVGIENKIKQLEYIKFLVSDKNK